MIAEKLQALVDLGIANSRIKDFFDIRFLAAIFEFDGANLARAVRTAFERRDTPMPTECPMALSQAFVEDAAKATQWRAFLRRSRLLPESLTLGVVIQELREFLLPVLGALARGDDFEHRWSAGGPWESICT